MPFQFVCFWMVSKSIQFRDWRQNGVCVIE